MQTATEYSNIPESALFISTHKKKKTGVGGVGDCMSAHQRGWGWQGSVGRNMENEKGSALANGYSTGFFHKWHIKHGI